MERTLRALSSRRTFLRVSVAIGVSVALALALAGCGGGAPAPTPTAAKPAAAPTKAAEPAKPAEPTKAPAAVPTSAPTAAPAAKVDYPAKGKSITLIVPWDAGGINDVAARALTPFVEKELGVPIQVVNKPGAGSQIGLTEIAKAKPDGYTIGIVTLPTAINTYLEPERKAVYTRKDFEPLALHTIDPVTIAVKADSPYKTTKDLIEAAKANPEKIKAADIGVLSGKHLAILDLQKATGAKFAIVHFSGGSQAMTALLGGHIDVNFCTAGEVPSQYKAGEVRLLGIMDKQPSKFYPGITTLESQGYKVYSTSSRGWAAPAGTPKEVVDKLSAALKKAMEDPEHQKKIEATTSELRYMNPAQMAAYWAEMEEQLKPLIQEVLKEQQKK